MLRLGAVMCPPVDAAPMAAGPDEVREETRIWPLRNYGFANTGKQAGGSRVSSGHFAHNRSHCFAARVGDRQGERNVQIDSRYVDVTRWVHRRRQ